MSCQARVLFLIILFVLGTHCVRSAELDEVQAHLVKPSELPLRWENVKVGMKWDSHLKLHLTEIAPGGSITFLAPPRSIVRIHSPHGRLNPNAVEVGVSDGSGLFAQWPVQQATDPRNLIVTPGKSKVTLIRVARPVPRCKKSISLAFFVSQTSPLREVAPYRCLIPFDCPSVPIRLCEEAKPKKFWAVAPGKPLRVKIEGPIRLKVQTRFRFPVNEARTFQFYRVRTTLNDRRYQVLEYETGFQYRQQVFVEEKAAALGRLESAFLEIPKGSHVLALSATAPLYLRILALKSPDYHLPGVNQPTINATTVRLEGAPKVLFHPPWGLSNEQMSRIAKASSLFVAEKERLALRLIRDNRYREGGLAGTMLMREAAYQRPDFPNVDRVAEKLRGFHTFFRNLLPIQKSSPDPQELFWFVSRRLRRPGEEVLKSFLPLSLRDDALSRLPHGVFCTAPLRGAPLVYPVPPRFGPSLLRVMALPGRRTNAPQELMIQYDQHPPFRLSLCRGLKDNAFMPSLAEMALLELGSPSPFSSLTLAAPFSQSRDTGRWAKPGVVEIPLPTEVKVIRLWSITGNGERIALQYRTGKPYRLSELEYLEMIRRLGGESAAHSLLLKHLHRKPIFSRDPRAARELINHWIPLLRLIRLRDRQFRSGVSPLPDSQFRAKLARPGETKQWLRKAQQAENEKTWLPALEAWTRLIQRGSRDVRAQALFGRIRALKALGEQFLADRQLRGLFLFDPEKSVRDRARALLVEEAQKVNDEERLVILYSIEVLRSPTPRVLAGLIRALTRVGEHESALLLGIGMSPEILPRAELFRCAYQLRWWETYERLLNGLSSEEEKSYWRAWRALAHQDGKSAVAHLKNAGQKGRALWNRLAKGEQIQMKLQSQNPGVRAEAVRSWQSWQAENPGPHQWRDEPSLSADYSGAISVYNSDRDLFSRYYLARPGKPLRLRVPGPTRLRLEMRPLHQKGSTTPQDDWIGLKLDDSLQWIPVSGNRPSNGLKAIGLPNPLGIKVVTEVPIKRGIQEITIAPERMMLAIRVFVQRPEMPLPVLPSITLPGLAELIPHPGSVPQETTPDSPSAKRRRLLAKGKLTEALALTRSDSDEEILARMTLLTRWAETEAKNRFAAQLQGEALFRKYPEVRGIQTLFTRLLRKTTWSRIRNVKRSAGAHLRQFEGWNPQSPALRARRALLTELQKSDRIVTGHERLVLSLRAVQPTTLTLELSMEDVAHLPPQPMDALVRLDNGPEKKVRLTPTQRSQTHQLTIPKGRHSVALRIAQPLANQFLRARVIERGTPVSEPERREYRVATAARPVVMTIEGPAMLRIDEWRDGAVRVRYQYIQAGSFDLTLRPEEGRKEAYYRIFYREATPDEPVIHPRYVPTEIVPVLPAPIVARGFPSPIAEKTCLEISPLRSPKAPPIGEVVLSDAYHLGGQENGVWSIIGEFRNRRALDEDLGNTRQSRPDRFGELRATHRFFDEISRLYFRTEPLVRFRERSGPTLGIKETIRHDPFASPWLLTVIGEAYLQRPGDPLTPGEGRWEGSALIRGRATHVSEHGPTLRHLASISSFGRLLTLDQTSYDSGRVDQDIFTTYKADHRFGVVLSDTLRWRPWLDTLFSSRVTLITNENPIRPDNCGLRLNWSQLLGAFQVDFGYRFTYFFKDGDRRRGSDRHIVDFGGRWDLWHARRDRVELGLISSYDLTRDLISVQAFLAWHFGKDRQYRDYQPGEVDFLSERRHREIDSVLHNRIWESD